MKLKRPKTEKERALSGYNWIQLYRPFLFMMSVHEALMLSYLISVSVMNEAWRKNEGWFFCGMSRIKDEINVARAKQTRLISALRDRGVLEVELRGNPARRWMRIDYDTLGDLVTANEIDRDT